MQRMDRYRAVVAQMLDKGLAYHCYMATEELDALRERQRAAGEKPRYDGTWRPEPGKVLPPVPQGVTPVVRFRNPLNGVVSWDDAVKGTVEISNEELDDLVIARPDGTPTYNFCVVVDDLDMKITHVIRGDDHVNNTPRQINILRALGGEVPVYAHLPDRAERAGREDEQAPRRDERDGLSRWRLPARSGAELPRASRLVAWRCRDFLARAVRRVVRPRSPRQVARSVRPRQAQLAQRALHQGSGQRAPRDAREAVSRAARHRSVGDRAGRAARSGDRRS